MVRIGDAVLRSVAPRALCLALLLGAVLDGGCTTNHDALALQPKAGAGGGGSGGTSGFGTGGFGNSSGQAQGGRVNPDDEPPGDNVLTIVNGVVDAASVRLCFARLGADGATSDFVGSPLPELAYAASTVLTSIDGLSLVDDSIQTWVIAGDLSRVKKLDCADAVDLAQSEEAKVTPIDGAGGAGGDNADGAAGEGSSTPLEMPTLRARSLAVLPAGTVNIGRSILMVLTGCVGGAAYTDHIQTSVCGDAYSPKTPTLQPVVVKLSRNLSFDKVGLQAVHASLPAGSVDVRASGNKGAVSLVFASSVGFGSIEPRPADVRFSTFDLGVDQPNYGLQAVNNDGNVIYQEAWSDILTASGISAIVAERTYTAVFLGPNPLLLKKGWWNAAGFSLVDNDPTRKD